MTLPLTPRTGARPTVSGDARMANLEECRRVINDLADQFHNVDETTRQRHLPDRTIELTLTDLGATWCCDLCNGQLDNIREETPVNKPQIRLTMSSDDLLAMNAGDLKFAHAWATGRIRLDASFRDLLRLRVFR